MNASIAQCRYHLRLANRLFAHLDDSHRALEPQPGMKTAGWLIGHLTVTGDFARHLCGAPALCAREWRGAFNPGTTPSHDPAAYPPLSELVERFNAVYSDLPNTVLAADTSVLSVPNPYETARPGFPTAGDFVAYLVSGHLAYHLGQLTAWRAAAGLGRVQASVA